MSIETFYNGEMETLRINIGDCINRKINYMGAHQILQVLEALALEMRARTEIELVAMVRAEELKKQGDTVTHNVELTGSAALSRCPR